jgi:tRNA pseudouridine38-40 synthase
VAEQLARRVDDWRVKLVLHYDGRNFFGWQAQVNRRTVQGELSASLEQLCGRRLRITAAGRTDRGVHATGQVASAMIPGRFDVGELHRALNAVGPPDLWVAAAQRVPPGFHPRYDAISRTYSYRIGVTAETHSPFRAPWCWPFGRPLDVERMRQASRALLGQHDFGAFAKSGQPERGERCHVLHADWQRSREGGILEFEISADRFLHRMVRYLVGTLAAIGTHDRPVGEIAALLRGRNGLRVAAPAPAQGLYLTRVDYPHCEVVDGTARHVGRMTRVQPEEAER